MVLPGFVDGGFARNDRTAVRRGSSALSLPLAAETVEHSTGADQRLNGLWPHERAEESGNGIAFA